MVRKFTRRRFLGTTGIGLGAASFAGVAGGLGIAHGATPLTGVQWGGPWIESAQKVTARQDEWDVKWELHTGGSAAIIPKIKSAWPDVPYDFVAQFDPLYYIWVDEGWPEPLTFEEMPNLRSLPEDIFHRNEDGDIVVAPISLTGTVFGYRKDIMPVELNRMEDLLDPKLRGKVIVRDATMGLNSLCVHFAQAFGGNEENLQPGWDFMKELVESGNVCRIAHAEVDFINALTTGECAVGFWNIGGWQKVCENFPCEIVIRDKAEAPGLQFGLINEGYMIPREAKNKEAAKEYINWFLSAENNAEYNKGTGEIPVNLDSQPGEFARQFMYTSKEDRQKYTYSYAFDELSSKKNDMISYFEQNIMPLVE